MKKFKKALAALLAVIMVASLFPVTTPQSAASNVYRDVDGHWAAGVINRWNTLGFIDPDVFSGSGFSPDKHITRVEFFSLISRSLGATKLGAAFSSRGSTPFSDVEDLPDHLYNIVGAAHQMGIALGGADGMMRPHDRLLRQDAATLAARALGMESVADWNLSRFSDANYIETYARPHVASFVEKDIISGYPDGSFRPAAFITRAEAVMILNRLFTNVYMPESGLSDIYMQGSLLISRSGAELRDSVIDGDVVIGDGVGDGNVVIADSTINGRLIVRGGGPNSITLSGAEVTQGIYVASYSADTRIAVTGNSAIPSLEAVSGLTLSGSGVEAVSILKNARGNPIVNLNGVSLDDLIIGGPGAQVRLNSGHAINVRFESAGQNASLMMAADTSVSHVVISAPNATVSGTGTARNMTINDSGSGAVIERTPEALTLAANVRATVAGQPAVSSLSQWSNKMIDRVTNGAMKVQLLTGTAAPFNQASMSLGMVTGSAATEVHVSQSASNRVPLTTRGSRLGYWVGFFIPAPMDAANMATVTYTYVDGEPITLPPRTLDTYNGTRGLLIYLPVFRESGREAGLTKELLYVNWGGQLTENINFMSSTMSLSPPNATQRTTLQKDFDNRIMYSIDTGAEPYTGAEATRRILNSDNPLGLPGTGNAGLDAINRAVSIAEARGVFEDSRFAADLTISASGNSQYSALSGAGKDWVADQVLIARKTVFATPSAVKTAFDKAVQTRLDVETRLLTQINGAADAARLRAVIETAANAAALQFQTGADPYKSYSAKQKNDMAEYLWKLRQYRSIQEVIDAIQKYLRENPIGSGEFDPDSIQIASVSATPSTVSLPAGNTSSPVTVTVLTSPGNVPLSPANVSALLSRSGALTWATGGRADYIVNPDGTVTITARNNAATGNDTLRFNAGGKQYTLVTVTITAAVKAASLSFTQKSLVIFKGQTVNLLDYLTITPPNATDLDWMGSSAHVSRSGNSSVITGVSRTVNNAPTLISVTARGSNPDTEPQKTDTISIFVAEDEYDFFVIPSNRTLTRGETFTLEIVPARPLVGGRHFDTVSDNTSVATITSGGLMRTVTAGTVIDPDDNIANITVQLRDAQGPLPPAPASPRSVVVQVDVVGEKAFEIWLPEAVMQRAEPQKLRLEELRYPAGQPNAGKLISPFAPGQAFYWVSENPRVAMLSARGEAPAAAVTTLRGQSEPEIIAEGVGSTFITLHMGGPSGPVLGTLDVISAPRGVSSVRFYENEKAMTPIDGLGLVIGDGSLSSRFVNLEQRNVRAEEPGYPERLMIWTMYESTPERSINAPNYYASARTRLLHNAGTSTMTAAQMGLYRAVVTPALDFIPGGWSMADDPYQRGRWYGRSGTRLPFFAEEPDLIPDPSNPGQTMTNPHPYKGKTVFNEEIDVLLSGLKLWDPGAEEWVAWDWLTLGNDPQGRDRIVNLMYNQTDGIYIDYNNGGSGGTGKKDHLVIYDANGNPLSSVEAVSKPLADAANLNPPNIPLVLKTANTDGSNELFVWVRPRQPEINASFSGGLTQLTLDAYNSLRTNTPGNIAILYEVLGSDFSYVTLPFGMNDLPLEPPWPVMPPYDPALKLTAWTRVNNNDWTKAGEAALGGVEFARTWADMPPVDPSVLAANGYVDLVVTLRAQYTTNRGFASTLDPNDNGEVERRTVDVDTINQNNPGRMILRIIPAPDDPVPFGTLNLAAGSPPPAAPPSTDPAWKPLFVTGSALSVACALKGITPANAIVEVVSTGAFAGTVAFDPPSLTTPNAARRIIGRSQGDVRLKIIDGSNANNYVLVTITVTGITGALAPISGISSPIAAPAMTSVDEPDSAHSMMAAVQAPAEIAPTAVALRSAAVAAVGKTTTLEPYLTPYNATRDSLKWTSSDTGIATVDGNGTVTGVKAGTAKITVTDGSGSVKAECKVTVKAEARPVTSITMNKKTLAVNAGASGTLSVTYKPSNATIKGVTWTSSDETVARVEPNGKVVGISGGTATITATSDSGRFTATCVVTVKVRVASVSLPENSVTLKIGDTYQINPVINPGNATEKNITYSSKTTSMATVSATGLVTARRAGTVKITVKADGKTATLTVKVEK